MYRLFLSLIAKMAGRCVTKFAWPAILAMLLVMALAPPLQATSPFLVVPPENEAVQSPAYRYANMSNAEAFAELDRRAVPYRRVRAIGGVRAPIRLTGRLHGVYIHSSLPLERRADTIFEVLDARLALALDDFSRLLQRHGIVEVVHYTMYRPNGPKPEPSSVGAKGSAAKKAKRRSAKRGGKKAKRGKKAGRGKKRKKVRRSKKGRVRKRTTRPKKRTQPAKSGLGKGQKAGRSPSSKRPKGAKQKRVPSELMIIFGAGGHPHASMPASGDTPSMAAFGEPEAAPLAKKASKKKASRKKSVKRGKKASKKKASRKKSVKRGKKASKKKASKPVRKKTWAPPGTRHPAGLAIDVGGLRTRDGRWFSVAHHFQGRLGAKTCGPGVALPKSPEARELRSIVCESADLGLFTYVLTPNYDAPHADHFHMEIRREVKWFLYH